jgi:hypothetical protein
MRTVRSNLPEVPHHRTQVAILAPTTLAADTLDDRVSENIYDVEDEWAEMEIICPGSSASRELYA